jgi:hypothetical protein
MKYFFFILAIITITTAASAGDVSLVPGGLLFRPLTANTFEPRVGFAAQTNNNKLRLDIGNSIDLVAYRSDSLTMSIGTDFFTYTSLRGEQNFHFPVDASDYFFGINITAARPYDAGTVSARLRVSHISAHFVDGHYVNYLDEWKDNRAPHVYSREFFDLTAAFEPAALSGSTRVYAGLNYLYHVDPTWLPKTSASAGGEYHYQLTGAVNLFGAYQATFMKVIERKTRHNLEAGAKLGSWNGRGVELYWQYYSGYSIHGEYFDVQEEYTGFGLNVDF